MIPFRTTVLMLGGLLAVGCHSGDESASATPKPNDVLDVHPAAMTAPTPVYTPVATAAPLTPMMASDSMVAAPAQPIVADAPNPASGKHVVKHGETMYSIARTSYGDGKQWQRIAAANPGVSPLTLKVGQTLAMP